MDAVDAARRALDAPCRLGPITSTVERGIGVDVDDPQRDNRGLIRQRNLPFLLIRVVAMAQDVTRLLSEAAEGSSAAVEELTPIVYADLHERAARCLQRERPGHTLQPTALVHEAYVRLVGQNDVDWKGRTHFLAVASRAMRRILTDYARARGRLKRGGGLGRVTLEGIATGGAGRDVDLIELDDALERFARLDPRASRVVELRFFGGLTDDEAARTLGVSPRTVRGDWAVARAWLLRALRGGGGE